MNKIGLFLLPVLAILAQPFVTFARDTADPSEVFLKAYMTAQQAEKLENENQFQPALTKLRFAGALLEELKKNNGDWQPAIVDYRSRKISDSILRVEGKLSTQRDLSNAAARAVTEPEPELSRATTESPAQAGAGLAPQLPAPRTAAIQEATRNLRARVEELEAELKKSRHEVEAAQEEKADVTAKLRESNSALEEAKRDLARSSMAEHEVREQLATAQKSLNGIEESGTGDEKAELALKAKIRQLQKALDAAQSGRVAAEKDSAAVREQLLKANKEVASVNKERDSMQRERDSALRELKAAGDAKARLQALVAENSDLRQRLAAAVATVGEISADKPKKEQELRDVKSELKKVRDQLVASERKNQESDKRIADLRSQLDEESGALAAAKLKGATSEESAQLVKENQMLRGIVIRERQEEARREQAKKLMLAEFDKLKIKSNVLDQQIHFLAEPITKLSEDELALLRQPEVAISEDDPSTIKASLTIAKSGPPPPPRTAGSPLANEAKEPPEPAHNNGAKGPHTGPEVDVTSKPNVPLDVLPLAVDAKRDFDHGKFRDAEKEYRRILAKNPNNLYCLSNLGVVFFRVGKLKAAEQTLKKAIAIQPKDEFTHTTLGIVYYRQSKFDDALSELTKSLAINPKSATAHNYLGITASQKGWQEAAEKEMLEAISDNPNYADAHFNLAVIYSTSTPPAKELARRHYEKALTLGAPPDPTMEKLLSP
ncbi:MAG TPA: tetratricopeptide repeat protein [Chthoniobacterales bacterium]|jgi:tetratricopeptide (TPR) repeat protein